MKKMLLLVILGMNFSFNANAHERGDTAFLCYKKTKFLWVIGKDSYESCAVRILERAGSSYRVLILEPCENGPVTKGDEKWMEGYQLYGSCSDG